MKNNTFSELIIDLTFKPASIDIINGLPSNLDQSIWNTSEGWIKYLGVWMHNIRSNTDVECPEIVRKVNSISLGLEFTDDLTIANVNSRWRNQSEVTDVISFPAFDQNIVLPEDKSLELGDIIISLQTAERQSKDFDHSLLMELRWLVSHGLLHLLGWDHPTDTKLEIMLNYQQQLLNLDVTL